MTHSLFGPEIRQMLADKEADGLRTFCESLHPATVAEALADELTAAQIWEAISPTDLRTQAAIFEYLPAAQQVEMIDHARPQVGQLVEKMSHDDRVDLLRRLPARTKESLLRLVDEADRRDIATLFTYGENTVGALMTTDYAWLTPDLTATEAIDQLRQQAPDKETIYYIYVLGDPMRRIDGGVAPRRLLGVITLRDLILAPRHARVRDLMEVDPVALRYTDDRAEAADVLARYDFLAVPVLDAAGGMVGIVTHDDVIDVIQKEATEDLQRQAAVGPIEGTYLEAGFATVWYNRMKWLAMLFVLQMVTVYVYAYYEDRLSVSLALMACLPLVLSVGGNAGSQAATLVVRALALDEIRPRQWPRVLVRELLMGLALAACLGVMSLVRTRYMTPADLLQGEDVLLKLTYTLGIAVAATCLWGVLLGSLLPLAIHRMGFDPALVSSPAIATLSDVSGIIIYASTAAAFFF